SIRVLDIAPGERDDILRGNFGVVQLGSDPPHYEALSYTWADASGNSKKCRAVYIGPFWDAVPITQNCADALCSVRFHHNRLKHRTLWIDAVCVNQTDVMERTSQVALMPEIYSSAAEVLVYLGLASNSSNTALETMSRSLSTNGCRHSNGGVMCQMCQDAISQLFQRPYFKRLWVVQEIMLSKSIVIFCGAVSSSLPFSKIIDLLPLDAWAVRRAKTPLGSKSDLFSLMIETNHCACQDPRDKVFALLGIPSDWSGARVLPDYSLSLDEVAIGVASYFIQVCELGWPILMLAGQKQNEAKHLPSWVPDIETSVKSAGIRKDLCDKFMRNSHRLNQELFIVDDLFVEMDLMANRPVISETKTGFRPPPIIFESQKKDIQITSRHSHLKLVASRLCNIHQAFDLDYMRYSHGVVVIAPALKSQPIDKSHPPVVSPLLFIQKLENSPTPWRVCSDFISEHDELYWLHSVEGYAILRPDSSCNMHTLVCVCDLAFTWSHSPPRNLADRLTLIPIDLRVVKRVRSVLETVISQGRNSKVYRTSDEINDETAVAKLALQLFSLLLGREHHLWRKWQVWKRKWDHVLEEPPLLEHVISVLESTATTTAEEKGRHYSPSKTTQAAIKNPKSVATAVVDTAA
ncbi:Heterokaryon incompatibility protein 6, partial [Colletotrichum gloeosporioides]